MQEACVVFANVGGFRVQVTTCTHVRLSETAVKTFALTLTLCLPLFFLPPSSRVPAHP